MEDVYKDSFKEVDTILNVLSEDIINKIPEKIRYIISEQKNDNYDFNLRDNRPLKRETLVILSYLYREYLCSDEKREILRKDDEITLNKLECINDEIRESNDIQKVFKKRHSELARKEDVQMKVIEEEKSIFSKIKYFFKNIFK